MEEGSEGFSSDDEVTTAVDYLKNEERLIQEAASEYPRRTDQCSFKKGYVNQLVYSCLSCYAISKNLAGLCYGCMVSCHTKCEVLELGYRRGFRCDCGTKKFLKKCELLLKHEENDLNKYNHNFSGTFCSCAEVYDSLAENRCMYQCILCEDWFHEGCMPKMPSNSELVCFECCNNHEILKAHASMGLLDFAYDVEVKEVQKEVNEVQEFKDLQSSKFLAPSKKFKSSNEDCLLKAPVMDAKICLVLKEGWRDKLCKCEACFESYFNEEISYILSEPIIYEPELDEKAAMSPHSSGLKELCRVDRTLAIDTIQSFETFKQKLKNYLKKFAEKGRVVTKREVKKFFMEVQAGEERSSL